MKQNMYNNDLFFKKYSQMERSTIGLSGAGEWSELQKLLPNFEGKRVLDLGCGYGWHCLYAANNGASKVIGIDISKKMLAVAKEKSQGLNIEYECIAMEDLELQEDSFEVVISSLAFHYIMDFEAIVKNIYQSLALNGYFVFSVEHPLFTSEGSQDWYYNEDGEILHYPVDNYYYEGKREAVFLGEKIIKYHRTLTSYINTLLTMGFELQSMIEPQPPKEMMDEPGMKDEMRRPMMLLIRAKKK